MLYVGCSKHTYMICLLLIDRAMDLFLGEGLRFCVIRLARPVTDVLLIACRVALCTLLIHSVLRSNILAAWVWLLLALGIHCQTMWCCRVLTVAVFACLASSHGSQWVLGWCLIAFLAPLFPPRSISKDTDMLTARSTEAGEKKCTRLAEKRIYTSATMPLRIADEVPARHHFVVLVIRC